MENRVSLRDDHNLHVSREGDDFLNQIAIQPRQADPLVRPGEVDLRDLIATRKIDQSLCDIFAFEDTSLDAHVARKVQMTLDRLAIVIRQSGQIA